MNNQWQMPEMAWSPKEVGGRIKNMEHSYVGGEILASISHRNVDNPLGGQIVDCYIVALGFKPTIRRQAQTGIGCSGDKGQRVEACVSPSWNLFCRDFPRRWWIRTVLSGERALLPRNLCSPMVSQCFCSLTYFYDSQLLQPQKKKINMN